MTLIAFAPSDVDGPGLTSGTEMARIEIDETGITVSLELADHDETLRLRFAREFCNPAVFALLTDAKAAAA